MCCSCLHVNTCCCGCSLRVGVLILGWVILVISAVSALTSIVLVVYALDYTEEEMVEYCAGPKKCGKDSSLESSKLKVCMFECKNMERYINGTTLYLTSWIPPVWFAVSGGLLIAVYADVPILLPICACVKVFAVAVYSLLNLILIVLTNIETLPTVLVVICLLLWWAIEMYFCVVVFSLYRTMTNPDQYPAMDRNAVQRGPPNYPQYPQYPQQGVPQ